MSSTPLHGIDFQCINFHLIITNIAFPTVAFRYYKMQCSIQLSYKYTIHIKDNHGVYTYSTHLYSMQSRVYIPNSIILPVYHTIQSIFSHTISVQLAIHSAIFLMYTILNNLPTEIVLKDAFILFVFCQFYIQHSTSVVEVFFAEHHI